MRELFPIKSTSELEKLTYQAKWQYFEKLVAFIFEENDYFTEIGVIFKLNGKHQIDVLAKKYDTVFAVECKKWRSKERASALRTAVKKHLERCDLYSIAKNKTVVPLIVTLLDDNIEEIDGVAVVPIMKLNAYLNGL